MIPDKYYKSLSNRTIGFAKITSLHILTHLITKYAEFEDDDVQEIDRKMKEPISGETLFEEFIEKIEWNQEALAVQNPYTPAQIFSMAYANIKKCGLYQDNCWNISWKPRLDKTWSNFKYHLVWAFKETWISLRTSNTEGYAVNVQKAQANSGPHPSAGEYRNGDTSR